ncbi:MAG: hypothetical protein U9N49_09175 [Campylobacterota bacterium]|nr:hypothetical protein [Campylobacterota bacterium]
MISLQIDNPTIEQKLFDAIKNQKRDMEDIVIEAIEKFLNSKNDNSSQDFSSLPSCVDQYIGIVKEDEIDKEFQELSNSALEKVWDNQEDEVYDRFLR